LFKAFKEACDPLKKSSVVDLDSVGSETLAGSKSGKIIADTDPGSSGSKATLEN
jgi:hypothetical protein